MTKYYKFAFDSQSIRATNRNRSNGGVAFVFVEKFGLSTRLKSVEVQIFSQVRNCIPQNKLLARFCDSAESKHLML